MKYQGVSVGCCRQPLNLKAFFKMTRIATTYSNNRCSSSFICVDTDGIQFLPGGSKTDLHQVILQPRYNHFCFRISKSAVIFYNVRIVIHLNEADEYDSLV